MAGSAEIGASSSGPSDSWKMFDRIAGRYDLLNHLLSFRRDVVWRKRICRHLPNREGQHVLDLATGTADVLLTLFENSDKPQTGVGMDMSANMLGLARDKVAAHHLDDRLHMLRSDATCIAVQDSTFDAATMAFGIRNVSNAGAALREIQRVLKPAGRALILEFSLPNQRWLRALYLFYFRHILPRAGGLVSGDKQAYRYLNTSVEDFPHGEAFSHLMRRAGFHDVQAFPLSFGIATLYQGDK